MKLQHFSGEFGRDISRGLLRDINARAGLPPDANGAESTTEASAPAVVGFFFCFLHRVQEEKKKSKIKN